MQLKDLQLPVYHHESSNPLRPFNKNPRAKCKIHIDAVAFKSRTTASSRFAYCKIFQHSSLFKFCHLVIGHRLHYTAMELRCITWLASDVTQIVHILQFA